MRFNYIWLRLFRFKYCFSTSYGFILRKKLWWESTEGDALYNFIWLCVAVCCSVLQCITVCCSVLQCVAVCCSVSWCSVLQWEMLGTNLLDVSWNRKKRNIWIYTLYALGNCSLALSLTRSLSCSISHALSLALSHVLSFSLSPSLFFSPPLSFSLSLYVISSRHKHARAMSHLKRHHRHQKLTEIAQLSERT